MRLSRVAGVTIFFCLLIPSAYLGWTFRQMPHLRATGDDQLYLVSSRSLAEGHGYRIQSLPGEPFQTKYPVLYPWLLSIIWKAAPQFPGNLPAFMLAAWLVLPFYVVAVKRTFGALGFPPVEGWLMCAFVVLNPAVLAAGTSVGPDLLCSTLLLVVFLLLRESDRRSDARVALAGVLSGAAYLLRAAVLPLLVTAPLYFLWHRRPKRGLLFACCMAPFVVGWSVWARMHLPATRDATTLFYTDYFGDLLLHFSWQRAPALMASNLLSLLEYAGMSAAFIAAVAAPALWGLVCMFGAIRVTRRSGLTQFQWFAAGYLAMLVAWPYKPLLRYTLPVLPLMVGGLGWLVLRLSRAIAPGRARPLGLATLTVLCSVSAVLSFSTYQADLRRYETDLANERPAYAWIRGHLPETARFVAAHDSVLYLYTGRQATTYEPLKEFYLAPTGIVAWREGLPGFGKARGAQYAFCDARLCAGALSEGETPLARAVLEEHYRPLFRTGKVTVYRLAD